MLQYAIHAVPLNLTVVFVYAESRYYQSGYDGWLRDEFHLKTRYSIDPLYFNSSNVSDLNFFVNFGRYWQMRARYVLKSYQSSK